MTRSLLLATILAGALTVPAAAQQLPSVPLLQAGAGGRYETQLDPKRVAGGRSPSQVAAFRGEVDRLLALLSAMPEVVSPPAPVCHRLTSWIELEAPHDVLAAEVGVMSPISFENGRCNRMTGAGVIFRLNALSLLFDPQQAFVRMDSGPSDWFLLPKGAADGRIIRIRDTLAFTHGRAPLLRAVSAERYLTERLNRAPEDPEGGNAGELSRWLTEDKPRLQAETEQMVADLRGSMNPADLAKIAEARAVSIAALEEALRDAAATDDGPTERQGLSAELAALDQAARESPACFLPGSLALNSAPGCPDGFTLVELNPDYFDTDRPAAIQLLVVETPEGRTHGENDARLAARRAVWDALDIEALAGLVQ